MLIDWMIIVIVKEIYVGKVGRHRDAYKRAKYHMIIIYDYI